MRQTKLAELFKKQQKDAIRSTSQQTEQHSTPNESTHTYQQRLHHLDVVIGAGVE